MYKMRYFGQEITSVEKQLIEMGNATKAQMEKVPEGLFGTDPSKAEALIQGDRRLDQYDNQVHTSVLNLIVLQPPLPDELKVLTTMMRVAREFERMGDQVVNIAEIANDLMSKKENQIGGNIESGIRNMNEISLTMMSDAFRMMEKRKYEGYPQVEEKDEEVDTLFHEIQHLISHEMKNNPDRIDQLAPFYLVIRYLERVADHVVNIVRKLKESQEEGAGDELDSN